MSAKIQHSRRGNKTAYCRMHNDCYCRCMIYLLVVSIRFLHKEKIYTRTLVALET